jgi:hypothetical protein
MPASEFFGMDDAVNNILKPNIIAKNRHYRGIIRSIQRQLAGNCYQTTVKDEDAIEIKTRDLYKENFQATITHNSSSPQKMLALAQQARVYKELGYSDEWILTNVMGEQNATEILRDAAQQRMDAMDPLGEMIKGLLADRADLTEKQKSGMLNRVRWAIVAKQADQMKSQPLQPKPNPASQPGPDTGNPIGSPAQRARAQNAATGQEALTTAARTNNLGGQNQ